MKVPYSSEKFIEKSKLIHHDVYDYSLVEYKKNIIPVKIICKHHGVFEQSPHNHLKGRGCKYCANNVNITTEEFIKKSIEKHQDKYDYSLCKYINNRIPVEIICKTHGKFLVYPSNHLKGTDCEKCKIEKRASNQRLGIVKFIIRSENKHNNFYDYSKTVFFNTKTKVEIICPKHGVFKQIPETHMKGVGCPKCKSSKGELEIIKYLEQNNIEYEHQKRFHDCKHKNYLIFDFYISEKNICIEYDGEQHFKSIPYFGGQEALKATQERDKIKNEYCKNNNITLIRVSEINNISNILNEFLI